MPGSAGASAVKATHGGCSFALTPLKNTWESRVLIKAQQTAVNGPCYMHNVQGSISYPLYFFHPSPPYLFSGLKHGNNTQTSLSRGMTRTGFTF